jgi:hypothetical protein
MRAVLYFVDKINDPKAIKREENIFFNDMQTVMFGKVKEVIDKIDFITFPATVTSETLSDCESCCVQLEAAAESIKQIFKPIKTLFHQLHKRFVELENESVDDIAQDLEIYKKKIATFLHEEKQKELESKASSIKNKKNGEILLNPIVPAAGKVYDSRKNTTYAVFDTKLFLEQVIDETLPETCIDIKIKHGPLKKVISAFGWSSERLEGMGIKENIEYKVAKKR